MQGFAERLDVQIGGALLDGDPEQLVDRPHHRGSARKVAQIVEIVVCSRRLGRRGCAGLFRLQRVGERRVDIVTGGDRQGDRRPQRELHRADDLLVCGRRDRQHQRAGLIFERKQPSFAQEARRHLPAGETATDEIGALQAGAAVEGSKLIRETRLRQLGRIKPIHVGGKAATRDRCSGGCRRAITQHPLAGEVIDEFPWDHSQPLRVVPIYETYMTSLRASSA